MVEVGGSGEEVGYDLIQMSMSPRSNPHCCDLHCWCCSADGTCSPGRPGNSSNKQTIDSVSSYCTVGSDS